MAFISLGRAPLFEDVSGNEESFSWKLTTDGVLTVTGNGKMEMAYEYDDFPWEDYKKYIDEIVIEEGITTIGYSAFENCVYLKKVALPDSLIDIYGSAFSYCELLEEIKLPKNLEYVGDYVFYNTAIKSNANNLFFIM